MKKIFFVALTTAALCSCGNDSQFAVGGEISGAEGKTVYFESAALDGVHTLDSVKLGGSGAFSFKHSRPEAPDFYRLRVDNKVVNFVVDSTETLKLSADYANFDNGYTIDGSESNQKIKELSVKLSALQSDADKLAESFQNNSISNAQYGDSMTNMVERYKNDIKINYIFSAPNTSHAYFALFQRLNGYLLFDPLTSRDDVKCFAAVATSFNNMYPDSERARNLYNIAVKGMKNTRKPEEKVIQVEDSQVGESGIIDINLRDIDGNERKLSELKGKVVILDFTVYESAVSASHNYLLRDLYSKYAEKGLEIYQVSLDSNEHFWKTSADKLPWVCVRDAAGIYSDIVNLYNIQMLPAVFIINRASELSSRPSSVEKIEEALKPLL